jgi:fatty acid desaturase
MPKVVYVGRLPTEGKTMKDAVKTILGLFAFFLVWGAAENLAAIIPAWFGYLFLAAVAIVPFAWVATRVLGGNR